MNGVVDRIEKNIVVVEINNNYLEFNLEKFPEEIKEGDLVQYRNGRFEILVDETISREKEIKSLFDSLLEKED